jgi:hypothetical protein
VSVRISFSAPLSGIIYCTLQAPGAPPECVARRDINDLTQFRNRGFDARCLDNLVNGENDTFNDRDMWLVPLSGHYSASQSGPLNTL